MQTKHVKKTQQSDGGLVKKEGFIDISNIMLVCPHTDKPTKVGIQFLDNGAKVRLSKRAKKPISDSFVKSKPTK